MDIADILSKDHEKIDKLLTDFREDTRGPSAKKKFEKLRWELEKHLFMEERAIFTFLRHEDNEDFAAIPELKKDHDMILEKMDSIEEGLRKKQNLTEDVTDLCNILIKHKSFEDDKIYPKLDAELNDKQKKEILERLKDFS